MKWYRKSAEQGCAKAQTALGQAYLEGRGVTGNYQEADKWFGKAAEQGDAEAQGSLLGPAYLLAVGTGRDYA